MDPNAKPAGAPGLQAPIRQFSGSHDGILHGLEDLEAVSYTHLTLPTILLV